MATIQELSDGRPDGARLGQNAADLISFHGAAPSAQVTFIATVTASTTMTAAVAAINSVLAALIAKGLMAAS